MSNKLSREKINFLSRQILAALDKKAVNKIHSQKKAIEEGSREWEILYRKYYNDELAKLGKLS